MNKHNLQSEEWKKIVIQLREVADQKGITQEEISDKTGMLQSGISRIFSMAYIPKISTLVLIANALGVELNIKDKESE